MSFTLILKTQDERKEGRKNGRKKSYIEVAAPPKNKNIVNQVATKGEQYEICGLHFYMSMGGY